MTQSLVRRNTEERDASGTPDITTMEELRTALQAAITLEYTTVPAYLSGLWTLPQRKGTYRELANILQRIVICEMRHVSIAANVLIATGGFPDLNGAALHPYPRLLPAGFNQGVHIRLHHYGQEYVQQGITIEQPVDPCPGPVTGEGARIQAPTDLPVRASVGGVPYVQVPDFEHPVPFLLADYPSIGAFYKSVQAGIRSLVKKYGNDYVFPNNGSLDDQYRYFGGQDYIGVSGEQSALALLSDVIDEGEGDGSNMWDENGDISHYFAFQALRQRPLSEAGSDKHNKYRPPGQGQGGDSRCAPTGDVAVPRASEVTRIPPDPRMYMYVTGTRAYACADEFNQQYAAMVHNLDIGFNAHPEQVDYAIGQMNLLAERAAAVYACTVTIGGETYQAAPTFELPPYIEPYGDGSSSR